VLIENAHDASANLALLGDKNLLFNAERTAFIITSLGLELGVDGRSVDLRRSTSRWYGRSSRSATAWRSSRCFIKLRPTTFRCTSTSD